MKFLLFFVFLALAAGAFMSPTVRASVDAFFRKFWVPLLFAAAVAVAFWVTAYGGDSIRLF